MSSAGHHCPPLSLCNSSSIISPTAAAAAAVTEMTTSFQQQPIMFQQQRQFYQQQEAAGAHHYLYNSNQEEDNDNLVDISLSTMSSSISPLISDYFYSLAAAGEMLQTTSVAPMVTSFGGTDFGGAGGGGGGSNDSTVNESATSFSPVNLWNVFDEQYMRHNLGWTIALFVAYTLILIIGVIGNCMVILVVLFRPQMRTVTNMFIMNLAVADLFVIVFCVPATLFSNIFTPWILGQFMCKGVAYVQGVSVCASAYSLAAISLDRCKAIYRPLERPRGISKSQAVATICFIWVIALLLTIPWAVIFSVIISERDGLTYCLETWQNEKHGKIYFLVANLICCYSLPLVIISISNVVIWCHVSHRKVPQDSASIGNIKRMHRQTRHGVRKMLGIVTLAFLLSWLPLYVIVTRVKFSTNIGEDEANILDILLPFAQWLGSWNSCINPVLYAFLNSKFRKSFKSLLPAWVPFVHRNEMRTITRNNVGRGTVTNGTAGTSASFTTVYTAVRSSGRSNNGSCRRFQSQKHTRTNSRSMLMNNSFHGRNSGSPPAVTVVTVGTTPFSGTSTSTSVATGNCASAIMTTTFASVTRENARVTDL